MGEKKKNWAKNHKKIIIIVTLIIIILSFIMFATKAWLYLNFILGNDIILRLSADKEDILLFRNQEQEVKFEAKITTNPFCTAQCESLFEDISNNKQIGQDNFTLRPGMPLTKAYRLKTEKFGEGMFLYRFNLQCQSKKTFFCNTKEESTSRNLLVTAEYRLTDDEKKIKEELKLKLDNLTQILAHLEEKIIFAEDSINAIDDKVVMDEYQTYFFFSKKSVSKGNSDLLRLMEIWNSKNYYLLNKEYDKINSDILSATILVEGLYQNISKTISSYNIFIDELKVAQGNAQQLRDLFIINESHALMIDDRIKEFNIFFFNFKERSLLSEKYNAMGYINKRLSDAFLEINKSAANEASIRSFDNDINYKLLCSLNLTCIEINKTSGLKTSCSDGERLKEIYISLNNTSIALINVSLEDLRKRIINESMETIPLDLRQSVEYIIQKNYSGNGSIIETLIKNQPESCNLVNISIEEPAKIDIIYIVVSNTVVKIGVEFKEPNPECCVFGKCQECCNENCSDLFPLVFLHGHAFNKDTEADYSLDAFNKIQKRLEEDGYLSAGSISLYTFPKSKGIWGYQRVPVSIKLSYYFDIFQEPENYVVVQTKSENIDTYSIRLKELLDTVTYKTGRDKVIIVAHSMGGLVARRYIQVFGTGKVEKLIMVGTPNKGIKGNVADYCKFFGENLECRDMNENSLFINKVNREKLPNIKIYNVIGTGCNMKNGIGDGIVLEENAKLAGASNHIINGTCKGLEVLHTQLLDINNYPEVYEIIKKSIQQK